MKDAPQPLGRHGFAVAPPLGANAFPVRPREGIGSIDDVVARPVALEIDPTVLADDPERVGFEPGDMARAIMQFKRRYPLHLSTTRLAPSLPYDVWMSSSLNARRNCGKRFTNNFALL